MPTKRVNLWSSPRNISTALMYSFAQRPDTRVVDEPLYAHYLHHSNTHLSHPGKEAILQSQTTDGQQVVDQVLLGPTDREIIVFKQMTHHLVGLDRSFLKEMENVLLIRDPRLILASFSQVIPDPGMEDVGIQMQYELYQQLLKFGQTPLIVDARLLLLQPEKILSVLCRELGIPFNQKMLQWEAGPRPEDGVWAEYWYASVHRSTGFEPYREKTVQLPEHLESLAQKCQVFYNYLLRFALQD